MSPPPTPSAAAPLSERDRMVVYLAILSALFLAALDQTIVATALPQMVEDLQGIDRYAWVATAYLLASTALALIYGKLADTYPRKNVTLGAIGLFLSGSVLCGLSGEFGTLPLLGDGMSQLVIFRGLQGAGGGGLFAMTFIVIADLFTPAERGRYQGLVGAVFGIASVLGPVVGGLLTDHAGGLIPGVEGWRWVFYVNIPVGAVAVWFILRRMPRFEPRGDRARPDLLGGALLLAGLMPFVLSLQLDKRRYPWLPWLGEGGPGGTDAWATSLLFGFGCVVLAAFVARSKRAENPILDFSLFQNDVFRRANLGTFFLGAAFMSVTIFLPLFLVNVLGVSATRAGAALIPFSIGIVFAATFSGQVVAKIGYRIQIVAGAVLLLVAIVLLANMGSDVSYLRVTLYMVMAGLGVGPSLPLYTLAIQNAVDVRFIGQATSSSQFFRQTGATVGAALMGTVLATTLGVAFATIELPPGLLEGSDATAEGFVSTGGADLPDRIRAFYVEAAEDAGTERTAADLRAEGTRKAEETSAEVRAAFTRATTRIYWLAAGLVVCGILASMRIPELPLRTTHDRAEPEGNPG
ncbi:MAG: MFS transporter [Gemmatimonadota bacterium]|nr:MFS transporter [Gemmatimonadota bacterium]